MLDPRGRAEVLDAVRMLHERYGMTIVYITHFMEESVAADRIVLMNAGQIVMDGTPQEVFDDPQRVRSLGLDVPLAAELAGRLRCGGINLPHGILRDEELIRCLSE